MASNKYDDFLPDVIAQATSCPVPVAINAIRNAAIQFCADSGYWQELQDEEIVTSSDMPYDLYGPSGAQVSMVHDCIVNGKSVRPIRMDYMDANRSNWRMLDGTECLGYYQTSPNQLMLFPTPAAGQAWTMRLRTSYVPLRNSTAVDGAVYQNYYEAIIAGALARLLMMNGSVWANTPLGMSMATVFEKEKTEARIEAEKSYGKSSITAQPRKFA